MAVTTEISWGDGTSDKIYLTRNASEGNQTVLVSSDANTGAARSKVVTFSASGATPVTLTVTQEAGGPREYTVSFYPTSLDTVNSVYDRIDESYPITNAFAESSSTTQARVYWVKGRQAETYVYLKFNLSSIPSNATIKSVGCSEKTTMTGTQSSRWSVRNICVTSGTTVKSNLMSVFDTTAHTFGDLGTWTWAELQEARMRYHITRGTNSSYYNSDYYLGIFGATLTVTYEV